MPEAAATPSGQAEPVPAITVVVPTYNRAASLGRLLDALALCERPPGGFEVIVVDDGSRDNTAEVVHQSRLDVRYVRQANRGPAAARNNGWRLARTPLVAFTDDDTLPDRRWLCDLVAEMAARPELAGLGGRVLPMKRSFLADFVQLERLVGHGVDERGVRYLITANVAYRTEALRALDGFDESFPMAAGEDTDLSFRILRHGGRLDVTSEATVLHEHRTKPRTLFRTYNRHGMAWYQLVHSHPHVRGGWPTRTVSPKHWQTRYRYYRAGGAAPATAITYCVMRAVGLVCFAGGMLKARREDARLRRPAEPGARTLRPIGRARRRSPGS